MLAKTVCTPYKVEDAWRFSFKDQWDLIKRRQQALWDMWNNLTILLAANCFWKKNLELTTKISLQCPQVTLNWLLAIAGIVAAGGSIGGAARLIMRLLKDKSEIIHTSHKTKRNFY